MRIWTLRDFNKVSIMCVRTSEVNSTLNLSEYLEPARKELASTEKFPIVVEYEHLGNKQRNVTHLEFTIVTQWELSQLEQKNTAMQSR
jgi:hypothetical protein